MRRGKDVSACEKADQRSLRWFGHVERMEEEKFVKRVSVRCHGSKEEERNASKMLDEWSD